MTPAWKPAAALSTQTAFRLAFIAITVAGGFMALLVTAWLQQLQRNVHAELDATSSVMARQDELRLECQSLEAATTAATARLQLLRARLPAVPDEALFLHQLSSLAAEQGVVLSDFRPGGISERGPYREIELRLHGVGPYVGLCRWLAGLTETPRALRITQLTLTAPPSTGGEYAVDLQLQLQFGLDMTAKLAGAAAP